jgi:hypothetical protein
MGIFIYSRPPMQCNSIVIQIVGEGGLTALLEPLAETIPVPLTTPLYFASSSLRSGQGTSGMLAKTACEV